MKNIFTSIIILMFVCFSGFTTYAEDTLFDQLFNGEKDLVTKTTTTTSTVKKPTNISSENIKIIDKNFSKMKDNLVKYSTDKKIELYSSAVVKINKLIILRKTTKEKSMLGYLRDLINAELTSLKGENSLLKELFGDGTDSICNTDYVYSNGDCVKKEALDTYDDNNVTKRKCYANNGSGNQFWYSTYRSKCYITTCNQGYRLYNDTCISNSNYNNNYYNNYYYDSSCGYNEHYEDNRCTSNTKYCSITNGYGRSTWYGTYRSSCYLTSCQSGYYLSNGNCISNNNNYYNNNCYNDQHLEGNICISNTKTCSVSNGYGNQYWYGNYWSNCYVTSCDSGYYVSNGNCVRSNDYCSNDQHLEGNTCVSNTKSCSLNNGYGTQTWYGGYWSDCFNISCNSGYYLSNGNCIRDYNYCSSDQHYEDGYCISNTKYCSLTNGYGTQSWNGSYWSDCYNISCYYGFYLYNGDCVR